MLLPMILCKFGYHFKDKHLAIVSIHINVTFWKIRILRDDNKDVFKQNDSKCMYMNQTWLENSDG